MFFLSYQQSKRMAQRGIEIIITIQKGHQNPSGSPQKLPVSGQYAALLGILPRFKQGLGEYHPVIGVGVGALVIGEVEPEAQIRLQGGEELHTEGA